MEHDGANGDDRREQADDTRYPFVPLVHEHLDDEEAVARSRAFLETMRGRRTVRQFSTEPVPFEVIANAVATAGTAPSGAHQQPWTFVVVSDPDVKRRIRAAAEEEEWDNYYRRMSEEWKAALRPLGTDWVKAHLTSSPSSSRLTVSSLTMRVGSVRSSTTTRPSPRASRSGSC